jgi:signal transduction histidine kinase
VSDAAAGEGAAAGAGRGAAGLALACDAEGRVVRVMSDGLGLAAGVAAGDEFSALVEESCRGKAEAFFAELRKRGAAFDWELTARGAGGRLAALHFAGAADGAGFLVVGARSRSGVARVYEGLLGVNNERADALRAAAKDLSARARERAERDEEFFEELTRLNNELAAAQRELAKKNAELERLGAQKTQWLGLTSHDLRNPLEVVLLYSQFLLEDLSDKLAPEQVEFVNKIERSSRFMLGLVNDLLDVSKIEAGRLELDLSEADLGRLVAENVQLNRVLAERKRIEVVCEAPAGPLRARLDAPKIEQVLNNLIGNAVKFSPPGSRVRVGLSAEGARAVIKVEDEGPGVPADELDKLFKPFGRTRVRSAGGEKDTGLGLAIVKRIVEGHGGEIKVGGGARRGATFAVSLPVLLPAAPSAPPGHSSEL